MQCEWGPIKLYSSDSNIEMDILFAGIGNRFYFDTGQFIMEIYDTQLTQLFLLWKYWQDLVPGWNFAWLYILIAGVTTPWCNYRLREAVKVEKKKKSVTFVTLLVLNPPPPPYPPSQRGKIFFAFLDELGHSEYFLKLKKIKLENGPWPPTPLKSWKIPTFLFFFFFFFDGFPYLLY